MNLKPNRITLTLAVAVLWSAVVGAQAETATLETAVAGYESAAMERVFDGTVEAVHQATVSAQTAGRIAEVGYDVDDFVEAGSVLVRFTDVEQSTALRQAEAQLAEARARSTEAEEEYRRAQNLRERNLGSQRDLDAALASRNSARARVTAAESAVRAARQQLDYTVVEAPYAGIVTERHVEVGETVTPGQPLVSGVSLERLRVVGDLPHQVTVAEDQLLAGALLDVQVVFQGAHCAPPMARGASLRGSDGCVAFCSTKNSRKPLAPLGGGRRVMLLAMALRARAALLTG